MIHVERGQDPLFGADDVRRAGAIRKDQERMRPQLPQLYLPELHRLFQNKCAYCESPIELSSSVIDHFVPVSGFANAQDPLILSKLYWENLYLSCRTCHSYKGAIDPRDRKTGQKWMIDPCAEDPRVFLSFNADATVSSRPNISASDNDRASRTIAALGLNRDGLVVSRLQVVGKLKQIVTALQATLPDNWRESEAFQKLTRQITAPEAAFSAAARDALARLTSLEEPLVEEVSRDLQRMRRPGKHAIDSIILENIGPFGRLELPLRSGWNLFLGDNGCGKSTCLRAIALALAGADTKAAVAGSRLLRAGEEAGRIVLGTDHHEYDSSLVVVHRGDVVVKAHAETLVAYGDWLTLAFPAVRGHATRAISGPTIVSPPEAGVHDLLPILDDDVDFRLDDTRQWIVNTILRAEGNESEEIRKRHRRLLDWWFEILRELMPGPDFEFSHLDRDRWQVLVKTADGVIPLEQLSLGMVSTIGWIGTLLRRLAEAYPDSEMPEHEPALVLIDEIDAHLHPAWQQRLVPLVRKRFPNIQVVAASHSALIANNLEPGEIVVFSRDDRGGVTTTRVNETLQGLRADQVLTSSAFGLDATRGSKAEDLLRDYANAVAAGSDTPTSKARLQELTARVRGEISSPPETTEERRKLEALLRQTDEAIENALRAASAEDLKQLDEMLEQRRAKRG